MKKQLKNCYSKAMVSPKCDVLEPGSKNETEDIVNQIVNLYIAELHEALLAGDYNLASDLETENKNKQIRQKVLMKFLQSK